MVSHWLTIHCSKSRYKNSAVITCRNFASDTRFVRCLNWFSISYRQALNQLEADINDVNQIFKDLARIVHDQGEIVDSIEANVEHASIHVEQGHVNVQQALHYQTQARKKKVILLIFLCALIFIVGLTVYLWFR